MGLSYDLPTPAPRPVRILVVDDHQDAAVALADLLRLEGFAADWRTNVADGLAFLRTTPVDLVVLDLVMPGQDGSAFLEAWRKDAQLTRIPVVVHTGHPMALPALARDVPVVVKCSDPGTLISTVMRAIESSRPAARATDAVHLIGLAGIACGAEPRPGDVLFPSEPEARAAGLSVCERCAAVRLATS